MGNKTKNGGDIVIGLDLVYIQLAVFCTSVNLTNDLLYLVRLEKSVL